MNPSSLVFHRSTALIPGLAIFIVSLSGSFGLIWMRDQIARTASSCARMELTLKELERDNGRLSAQIARAHQPAYMQAQMPAGMTPTPEARVVWVEAPRHRTAPRSPVAEPGQPVLRESPLVISFDLALLDNPGSQAR